MRPSSGSKTTISSDSALVTKTLSPAGETEIPRGSLPTSIVCRGLPLSPSTIRTTPSSWAVTKIWPSGPAATANDPEIGRLKISRSSLSAVLTTATSLLWKLVENSSEPSGFRARERGLAGIGIASTKSPSARSST